MILNQMIDGIVRTRLCVLYRGITRLSILLLLSACGGGLGGSGDGSDTSTMIAAPDTFEPAYQFRHVPERLMARFPSSLANDESTGTITDASPYNKLTSTVGRVIDSKLEIGLLQLHLEANWLKIIEHCSATPEDSACDLNDAGISTPYTAAMASWEFLLRANILVERSGNIDTLSDDIRTAIAQQVTNKIGTSVRIENGTFTKNSSGIYRYEITVTADLGFGESAYTTRWSENKEMTFVSLADINMADININEADHLQSSTNFNEDSEGFSNAILITTYQNKIRLERQLNLNQPSGKSELRIESNLTEIQDSTKTDYYSIGNTDASGGYLSSKKSTEDDSDTKISDLIRESFNGNAVIESKSICRMNSSEMQCDDENLWDIITSGDPISSQFFLTPAQLNELEDRLTPFELDINGVSLELDTLLLIRRENLTISFTDNGIIVTVPGLGTFNLSNNSIVREASFDTENPESFSEYADSILCRINTSTVNGQTLYRSFCAGTTEEIETALVVGESFREGKLVIEWQANGNVSVIER